MLMMMIVVYSQPRYISKLLRPMTGRIAAAAAAAVFVHAPWNNISGTNFVNYEKHFANNSLSTSFRPSIFLI